MRKYVANNFVSRLKLAYKAFKENVDYSKAVVLIDMYDPVKKQGLMIYQATVKQNITLNNFYIQRGYPDQYEPRMLMANGTHFLRVRVVL